MILEVNCLSAGFDDVVLHIGCVFDGSLFRQRMVSSI